MDIKDTLIKTGLGLVTGGPFGAIAGFLSEVVPDVTAKVTESGKQPILDKAVEIGRQVLGVADAKPEDVATALINNPEFVVKYKMALLDQKTELERIQLEHHKLDVANMADARGLYVQKNEEADKIAERVIKYNIWIVVLLIACNAIALMLITDKTVALVIGNIFGSSIHAAWSERQQVIAFFFGSSIGSKKKSEHFFTQGK